MLSIFSIKKKKESTATLGALLQRKQKVGEEREESRKEETFTSQLKQSARISREPEKKSIPLTKAPKEIKEEKREQPETKEVSTTGRLLAKKRKMKDE